MIITIIADIYGEENNGTVATTNRLMQHMIKRGHSIRLVSTYAGKDTKDIQYFVTKKRNFYVFNKYISANGAVFAKPDRKILEEAIKGSDVVHMLIPFKLAKLAVKVAKELKVPMTSAFHTQPENISTHIGMRNVTMVNKMFYHRFYKQFYKHHNFVHCPSHFIKDEIAKNNYKGDLRVISNGVIDTFRKFESTRPAELNGKYLVFTSSRYSGEKRHDLVIEAVKHSKYADKIQLIFAGKGPLKDKLTRMSAHLPNPTKFVFYTSKQDLAAAINYSDLYVHPADIEIEAIACMEAVSCGLVPVISDSNRSATKQFAMTEKNLFEQGNAKDLAAKIDYWIEHPEEKEQLSKEYETFTEQFRIEAAMDKMELMFKDAIAYYNNKNN